MVQCLYFRLQLIFYPFLQTRNNKIISLSFGLETFNKKTKQKKATKVIQTKQQIRKAKTTTTYKVPVKNNNNKLPKQN